MTAPVPSPLPSKRIVMALNSTVDVVVMVSSLVIISVHVLLLPAKAQSKPQPVKSLPGLSIAVKVTWVPRSKMRSHGALQTPPAPAIAMLASPSTWAVTGSTTNDTPTERFPDTTRTQLSLLGVPKQSPVHSPNVPEDAAAVSVTSVPGTKKAVHDAS